MFKQHHINKPNVLLLICLITVGESLVFCQTKIQSKQCNSKPQFTINNPGQTDVFVKNHGQFDYLLKSKYEKTSYVINSNDQVFFTPHGYIWKLSKIKRNEVTASEREECEEDDENNEVETYFISMNWKGANANTQLLVEEETDGYYTCAIEGYRDLKAKGYRKLIYKDLYPAIDVEYIIPKNKGGIKYSLIVKPGGDITKVKMNYSGDVKKIEKDTEGNVVVKTPAGDMIDYAPKSFYKESNVSIPSFFELNKNTVEFSLPQVYNNNTTLVIDPWTIAPNLFTGFGPYDVDYDQYGNVYIDYIVGACTPQISKYSPAGVFLWSINMAILVSHPTVGYSDFCVIPSGSVFIASGYIVNKVCKISNTGILLTTTTWPNTLNNEGWVVAYNKCINTLLIGGGGVISNTISLRMGIDTALVGTISGSSLTGNTMGCCNDIARMLIDNNGDLYSYFTNAPKNTIFKSIPPYATFTFSKLRVSANPFNECRSIPGAQPGVPSASNRLNVMDINSNYLYFFDGKDLEARSKTTGNLINSITVSASYFCGSSGSFPFINPSPDYINEGIAVDECDNVYVGGQGKVHVFNFNGSTFSTLLTFAVPGNVYDIMLDKAKQLIYVAGNGFLSSLTALPSCNPLLITPTSAGSCIGNGTASVNVSGGFAPYTYLWSNGGNSSGITASPGTYTVTVTDGSCSNPQSTTTVVTIGNSGGISINSVNQTTILCFGGTASATVITSGGSSAYTYNWTPSAQTTATATGLIAGTTYTVTVTDAGNCSATANVSITSPLPLSGQFAKGTANCTGCGCKEWILVNAIGGTSPYSYSWPDGYINRNRNHLCPGAYLINIKDKNGCNTNISITTP